MYCGRSRRARQPVVDVRGHRAPPSVKGLCQAGARLPLGARRHAAPPPHGRGGAIIRRGRRCSSAPTLVGSSVGCAASRLRPQLPAIGSALLITPVERASPCCSCRLTGSCPRLCSGPEVGRLGLGIVAITPARSSSCAGAQTCANMWATWLVSRTHTTGVRVDRQIALDKDIGQRLGDGAGLAPWRGARSPSHNVSHNGVVDLDQKVEQQDSSFLEGCTPSGAQQCVGEIAALSWSKRIELDAQLAHRALRRAVSLACRRLTIPRRRRGPAAKPGPRTGRQPAPLAPAYGLVSPPGSHARQPAAPAIARLDVTRWPRTPRLHREQ
jgi:hypothetical protein